MHKEKGERRDFLPPFFAQFAAFDVDVVLERGYGEQLGLSESDYLTQLPRIRFADAAQCYAQDLVVVVRAPEIAAIATMRRGAGLMAMLHYDTRPKLLQALKENGIHAFSLDAIVDDEGSRQVVTYEMTAYGGMREAFRALQAASVHDDDRGLQVAILGMGRLGMQAARFAYECYREFGMEQRGWAGISVAFLEKEITAFEHSVRRILGGTDILVDATRRPDATRLIVPNAWLASLPEHAVILDLTADPYEMRETGLQVKAIEGIPHGNLDGFAFHPETPEPYGQPHIPAGVDTRNRRVTISCNAWPGVVPEACMREYGKKITPYMKLLLQKGFSPDGGSDDPCERALFRATIPNFEQSTR